MKAFHICWLYSILSCYWIFIGDRGCNSIKVEACYIKGYENGFLYNPVSKQLQDIKKEIGKKGKNKNSNLALLQGLTASILSNLKGWWDSLQFSVCEGSHKYVILKFRTAAFINMGSKLKEKKQESYVFLFDRDFSVICTLLHLLPFIFLCRF